MTYCTLEEAWGTNFEKKEEKNNIKRKRRRNRTFRK